MNETCDYEGEMRRREDDVGPDELLGGLPEHGHVVRQLRRATSPPPRPSPELQRIFAEGLPPEWIGAPSAGRARDRRPVRAHLVRTLIGRIAALGVTGKILLGGAVVTAATGGAGAAGVGPLAPVEIEDEQGVEEPRGEDGGGEVQPPRVDEPAEHAPAGGVDEGLDRARDRAGDHVPEDTPSSGEEGRTHAEDRVADTPASQRWRPEDPGATGRQSSSDTPAAGHRRTPPDRADDHGSIHDRRPSPAPGPRRGAPPQPGRPV